MRELRRADVIRAASVLLGLLALDADRDRVATTGATRAGGAIVSGRGKSRKSLELIDAAVRILEENQPATVRAVCYQLFIRKRIATMEKKYTSMVSKQLVWAREHDRVPWAHIVDETREAECTPSWEDPEAFINSAVRQYRKNYWTTQPEWIEVWSEKGTVRGTLAPVLDEYGITFRVMHGYGSATALHSIADETTGRDKHLTVLYVGDWDPSGMDISERDAPKRLKRYAGSAEIIRVALNEGDVGPNSTLPSFDVETKRKDSRYPWFKGRYGNRCWELDALSPAVLRQRVDFEIQRRLDIDAWNHSIEIEAAETDSLRDVLGAWRSISRPDAKYPDGAP